jgi:hypothetical protein
MTAKINFTKEQEEEILSKDWENICLNKINRGINNAKT